MSQLTGRYTATIRSLMQTIENAGYASYDPYDAMRSPAVRAVNALHPFAGRVMTQLVKRSPLNLRPLLGIDRTVNDPKVLADAVQTYLHLGTPEDVERARNCGKRLIEARNSRTTHHSWGLQTPFRSRSVYSVHTSNLFTTVNAAMAIVRLYEATKEEQYREFLIGVNDFLMKELGFVTVSQSEGFFRYYPGNDLPVYNVNALALEYLSAFEDAAGSDRYAPVIASITAYLVRMQNSDGSWFYAPDSSNRWVDGFHTGYILQGLLNSAARYRTAASEHALEAGRRYYQQRLYGDNFPLYYPGRKFPIDSQNCAQAVQTRVLLLRRGWDSDDRISSMIHRIDEALGTAGDYHFQRGRWFLNPRSFFRWGTAPMALALSFADRS